MPCRPVHELLAGVDDPSAWRELVDRYCSLVWSVALSFRLDEAAAADVTQAVWLRLLDNRDRIREPERLAGWLAVTTRNEALALVRQAGRVTPVDRFDDRADPLSRGVDEAVVDTLHDAELHRRVRRAFAGLGEPCRQLLELMTCEPRLDYATIAEVLGRPVGSLGPTRARCLAQLRALLEDQAASDPTGAEAR